MADQGNFSHIDDKGSAKMVNVGDKSVTKRVAVAEGVVRVGERAAAMLTERGKIAKGNVLDTARIAGIMAVKKTPGLIPMCHPIIIDNVEINAEIVEETVRILVRVEAEGKTGVEMEAMTAAAVTALTVYDMCKSVEKGIIIESVRLLRKSGGKSGLWERDE
ncbi:MAG: cyclic pyranopterin monophosphate synthase MoaC [bacterium]|nr:cyclic pyranopterin monophosphate synthase MoaC [bacterium]